MSVDREEKRLKDWAMQWWGKEEMWRAASGVLKKDGEKLFHWDRGRSELKARWKLSTHSGFSNYVEVIGGIDNGRMPLQS